MGLYARFVLPRLVNLACGSRRIARQRRLVVPEARGRVLELGFGSGLNLEHYVPGQVEHVWALEPAAEMWALARARVAASPIRVEPLAAPAEAIPLEDRSVDSVVLTHTLCTVPDVAAALAEVRRVLCPSGRVLFSEHGEAPDASVRRWQHRITPLWRRLSGGCSLDRPIPALLEGAGLRIERLEGRYLPGWRPATFNFSGIALP